MKITLTRDMSVGGHAEWALEIEREDPADQLRWASEAAEKFEMAVRAIREAPESAKEIAEEALG